MKLREPYSLDGLIEGARAELPAMVAVRRRLHRHPEVGSVLPETQAVVVDELARIGLRPIVGSSISSVIAEIPCGGPGPTIVLRADMDGLPISEDTGLEFASETPGAMHACGHDLHVAMLLGAIRLIVARVDGLGGRILAVFQPGEESDHGARVMLDDGLLDGLDPDQPNSAFAFHVFTRYETGTVHARPGPLLAASDTIRIRIRGRGGHASAPHLARDPTVVAAEILLALQVMVTRQIDVFDPAVVTIGSLTAAAAPNAIPEVAVLTGTMRTISETTRTFVHANIRRLVAGIGSAHQVGYDTEIEQGYPVALNNREAYDLIMATAREMIGVDSVNTLESPVMAAEDFAYILERVPGAMAFLGARPAGVDLAAVEMNHSSRVIFDERAMTTGAALYAAVAIRSLTKRNAVSE